MAYLVARPTPTRRDGAPAADVRKVPIDRRMKDATPSGLTSDVYGIGHVLVCVLPPASLKLTAAVVCCRRSRPA